MHNDFSEESIMKKIILGCCLLITMTTSCGKGKSKIDPFEALTEQLDSLQLHTDEVSDTVPVRQETVPVTADESFDDFFYNFASNERFQHSRIIFPISYYQGNEVTRIAKNEWEYDPLFSQEPVYTILFDKEEEMEMEKDTAIHSVQVDWIYLHDRKVKRYYFQRVANSWFLEAINKEHLAYNTAEGKEDFFDFYFRFANDSIFQSRRLRRPLKFITADPEDEFQILETTLDEGQWFSFRPPLLKERLTNVHYGQEAVPDPDSKIIEFKGFGNGFSNTLYFECRRGEWKLIKFEDLSD